MKKLYEQLDIKKSCYDDGYKKGIAMERARIIKIIDSRFNETIEIDRTDWRELKNKLTSEGKE